MTDTQNAPEVLTTRDGSTFIVTINRPVAKNAVNRTVAECLAAALDELESDNTLAVGVITGAGGSFCAGMDLKAFLRGENVRIEGRGFAGVTQTVSRKPLIAAVEGYALAGGFEIALACDLIVAGAGAKFGLPEVKRGLVPNAGGLIRLPRQMPVRIAMELVLLGHSVSASYLAGYGLVNRIVADGTALDAACEMAAQIAANGPLAIRVSKDVMRRSADWTIDEMFELQNSLTRAVFTSNDAREGALAFAEKRTPVWSGT